MYLTLIESLQSILRLSALRQALLLTGVFVAILLAAGYLTVSGFQNAFERRTRLELQARYTQVADDIITRGFIASDYPNIGIEQVFFAVDGSERLDRIFQQTGFFAENDLEDDQQFQENSELMQGRMADDVATIDDDGAIGGEWLYLGGQIQGGRLVVAISVGSQSLIFDTLMQTLVGVGVLSILVAMFIGGMFGLHNQRRIDAVRNTLELAANGDLGARINFERINDDLDQLAHTVDNTIAKLEVLVRQVREFSTNIAHDLKTPLTRLRLQLERVLSAQESGADSEQEIRSVLQQADKIIGIFDAFLRIARLEAGASKAEFEPIDIADLAHEVAETYDVVVEDSGRELKVETRKPATLQGDRVLLIQMLANLVENSIRHTPVGTEMTIVASEREFGLADTGPGIPPEEFDKVIQPMYRLEKNRTSDGAGMGLSLVKTIAELHGGQLVLSGVQESQTPGLFVRAEFPKNFAKFKRL